MANKGKYLKDAGKGFLVFAIGYLVYRAISPSPIVYKPPTIKSISGQLQDDANHINKNSYTWKDSVTEFLYAKVISDSELQFNFALRIDTTKYDMKFLRDNHKKNLRENLNKYATEFYKKNNITISYNITDTAMHPLYKIIFTPNEF